MSWFSTNYEKVALGGAVAVALGLCYVGWSKFGSVNSDFDADLKGRGNNSTAVTGSDRIPKALASLQLDRNWTQAEDAGRPVDLFTGIPLFISIKSPEVPIDLLDKSQAPVHPPIPNQWWIDHRLDPGYADSPNRDPDDDGYTNLEEFKDHTDPNDAKSHPLLIWKLTYVKDESLGWVVRPGYGSAGKFSFKYADTKGARNSVSASEMVGVNGLFFSKEPMKNRFKLLSSEVRKEHNNSINADQEITFVKIEDQKENKKGTVYEIPSPLSESLQNKYLNYDRTAVMSLKAIGFSGREIKVEENTRFALPPDAPSKDYLLKKVTVDTVEVEYSDTSGVKKSVTIPKGSFATHE
jgi:hypothetical protein